MPDEFIESKIQELVKQKDWRRLKEILSGWPAPDIADLFENIRVEEVVILFRCHRFIDLFFNSKMVAEVLITHKLLSM